MNTSVDTHEPLSMPADAMRTTSDEIPAGWIPAYQPLESIPVARPVDRIDHVRKRCSGATVLDLGAMDETAFGAKRGEGTWLHEEIAKVARQVIGLDTSREVPPEGLVTGPNSVIHRGDGQDLGRWLDDRGLSPDVVVAGELIEHVDNPLSFLTQMRQIDRLRGATLILTTPNASALHNALVGVFSRESTHHDHLCILSFKTLSTLMRRAGFSHWQIRPYYSRFTEMRARQSGAGRLGVDVVQACVNLAEWCCPLLSFGLIVEARL